MNALIQAFNRHAPENEDEWTLLWHGMAACIPAASHFEMCQPWTVPPLFGDALDLAEKCLDRPDIDNKAILGTGYCYFVNELLEGVQSNPYLWNNFVGTRVVSTVLHHPVWTRAKEIAHASDDWPLADDIRRMTAQVDDVVGQAQDFEPNVLSSVTSRASAAHETGLSCPEPNLPISSPNPYMTVMPDSTKNSSQARLSALQLPPALSASHGQTHPPPDHCPISPGSCPHHEDVVDRRSIHTSPGTSEVPAQKSSPQHSQSCAVAVEMMEVGQDDEDSLSSRSVRSRPADVESGYHPSQRSPSPFC